MEDPRDIVRRHALGLRGTTSRVLKGDEHYVAHGYTFAFLRGGRLVARLAPTDSNALIEEGKVEFFQELRSSGYGDWVVVDLAQADPDLLRQLVNLAYGRAIDSPLVGASRDVRYHSGW